jgi:protein-S-isoprenylcysteine O-methyltransferase Ste14
MRIPALGPRGEGWAVAQSALAVAIVVSGIAGPRWSGIATPLRLIAGIAIGIMGLALLVAGVVELGSSLTPFPRPSQRSTLRTGGAYQLVRHPIYGGSILVALGWSLISSPLALFGTAFLSILFELKSRHEESMLMERFPEYEAYRRRVRWRFIRGVH